MVIAVLGILGMMAIPGLQETAVKKQVKEGMGLADLARRGVQATYSGSGAMPADNNAAGIPPADKIISNLVREVKVDNGAVTITFGNSASRVVDGKKLTLRPAIVAGQPVVPISWFCHSAKVPTGMDVKGTDTTDIPDKYLPLECRATT